MCELYAKACPFPKDQILLFSADFISLTLLDALSSPAALILITALVQLQGGYMQCRVSPGR